MHFSALIKIESPPRSNRHGWKPFYERHESFSLKDTTVIASMISKEKEKAEPNFKATNVTVISKSSNPAAEGSSRYYRVCECSAAKRKTKLEAASTATREDALPEKWQSEKKYWNGRSRGNLGIPLRYLWCAILCSNFLLFLEFLENNCVSFSLQMSAILRLLLVRKDTNC